MPLHAKGADVKEGENVLQIRGGSMSTKMIYGNDCNLMVATRGAGYHSNPHRHDCEQLNYVMAGEVWVFVDDDAFLMKAGDFSRIPRNALHWAWNRGTEDCVLLEVHAPACDPLVRKNALGLYAEGEKPDLSTAVATIRTGDNPDAAERKVFGDAL
jgi:mannose-6-phosphate isomerase-like protein (cupin superfamily)